MKKEIVWSALFIVASLFLFWKGVVWLAIAAISFALFFIFSSRFRFFKKNKVLSGITVFLFIFIFAIALRVFFIEMYSIPSGSMEDTLIAGDKVLVTKLAYGPGMPRSPFEIPWVNLFFYLNKNTRSKKDSLVWDYKRLKGFSSPERNDVMVFRHPVFGGEYSFFVKRCVALPGDTLAIKKNVVIINKKILPETGNMRKSYEVWVKDVKKFQTVADSLEIERRYRSVRPVSKMPFQMVMNNNQFTRIGNQEVIDSISILSVPDDSLHWVYPEVKEIAWTINNYGPLVVPEKGMTIQLTRRNYLIYQRTIDQLEKVKLEETEGKYFLDGKPVTNFTFKHNYYFFMGDNRDNSNDSRYWGFVPEENIIGKASLILFSNDYNGFKRKRTFKRIK